MVGERLFLPQNGYEKIVSIILTFLKSGADKKTLGLQEISHTGAINRTVISRNNKFLTSLGILKKLGRGHRLTTKGMELALALEYQDSDKIRACWREIVSDCAFLNQILQSVNLRHGMKRSSFMNHLMLSAGVPKKPGFTVGTNAIIDILLLSGFLIEENSLLKVSKLYHEVEGEKTLQKVIPLTSKITEKREKPYFPLNFSIQLNIDIKGDDLQREEFSENFVESIYLLVEKIKERFNFIERPKID